jgi:site-specific DNA-cytosine methylase
VATPIDMATPTVTCLSLCSGSGMFEQGIRLVVPGLRSVGSVEWDSYAAAVQLARMADQTLEPCPVFCGDLAGLDTAPFLGVDLITAGFSCQPWSAAGKRLGTEDKRWIWPAIARIVADTGSRFVFLENVPGLVRPTRRGGVGDIDADIGLPAGLDIVLGDLADLGFDAEWCRLGADDVGAPHIRKRVFILAYANRGPSGQPDRHNHLRRRAGDSEQVGLGGGNVADADGEQPERDRGSGSVGSPSAAKPRQACQREWPGNPAWGSGAVVAYSDSERYEVVGFGGLPDQSVPPRRIDPHRCREALADPSSLGDGTEVDRCEVGWEDTDRPAGRAGGSSENVGYPDSGSGGERFGADETGQSDTLGRGPIMAHAHGLGRGPGMGCSDGRQPRPGAEPEHGRTGLADPDSARREGDRPESDESKLADAGRGRWLFPPGRDDISGWRQAIAGGCPQPSVRRDADGLAARLDRLRVVGNGVSPHAAGVAFAVLAHRAGCAEALGIRLAGS